MNALQCVEPVLNLQMTAQWGFWCGSHLRKLGLCVLDLALKLLQIHRNLDDILVLHHVPHNAPEQTKQIMIVMIYRRSS